MIPYYRTLQCMTIIIAAVWGVIALLFLMMIELGYSERATLYDDLSVCFLAIFKAGFFFWLGSRMWHIGRFTYYCVVEDPDDDEPATVLGTLTWVILNPAAMYDADGTPAWIVYRRRLQQWKARYHGR